MSTNSEVTRPCRSTNPKIHESEGKIIDGLAKDGLGMCWSFVSLEGQKRAWMGNLLHFA